MPKLKPFTASPIPNLLQKNFLNRITCNLFPTSISSTSNNAADNHQTQPQTTLERRTIKADHISTISSLVDRTNSTDDSSSNCDSQRYNYGLYALKYNRSRTTASKRNEIRQDLSQKDVSVAVEPPESYTSSLKDSIRRSIPLQLKHEYFEPSLRRVNNKLMDDSDIGNEYYKIEFSEEGGLKELKFNTNLKNNNSNSNNNENIYKQNNDIHNSRINTYNINNNNNRDNNLIISGNISKDNVNVNDYHNEHTDYDIDDDITDCSSLSRYNISGVNYYKNHKTILYNNNISGRKADVNGKEQFEDSKNTISKYAHRNFPAANKNKPVPPKRIKNCSIVHKSSNDLTTTCTNTDNFTTGQQAYIAKSTIPKREPIPHLRHCDRNGNPAELIVDDEEIPYYRRMTTPKPSPRRYIPGAPAATTAVPAANTTSYGTHPTIKIEYSMESPTSDNGNGNGNFGRNKFNARASKNDSELFRIANNKRKPECDDIVIERPSNISSVSSSGDGDIVRGIRNNHKGTRLALHRSNHPLVMKKITRQGSSSEDSVNIFKPNKKSGAFDDFDEIFGTQANK